MLNVPDTALCHKKLSPQPDAILHCETKDTGLVHHVVCLFTLQPFGRGIKLYCLVTEAHRFEQLAQGCYERYPAETRTRDLRVPECAAERPFAITVSDINYI